jgi:hypothetical protein
VVGTAALGRLHRQFLPSDNWVVKDSARLSEHRFDFGLRACAVCAMSHQDFLNKGLDGCLRLSLPAPAEQTHSGTKGAGEQRQSGRHRRGSGVAKCRYVTEPVQTVHC